MSRRVINNVVEKKVLSDLSVTNQLLFSSVNKLQLVRRVVDAIVNSVPGDKIHISCENNDTVVDIYMGF